MRERIFGETGGKYHTPVEHGRGCTVETKRKRPVAVQWEWK